MTLSNTCSSVKVGMDIFEPLDTVRTPLQLRHGEGFAKGDNLQSSIFQKSVQLLAYVDNIEIKGCTKRERVNAVFSAI